MLENLTRINVFMIGNDLIFILCNGEKKRIRLVTLTIEVNIEVGLLRKKLEEVIVGRSGREDLEELVESSFYLLANVVELVYVFNNRLQRDFLEKLSYKTSH